jgi:hypothetical protein
MVRAEERQMHTNEQTADQSTQKATEALQEQNDSHAVAVAKHSETSATQQSQDAEADDGAAGPKAEGRNDDGDLAVTVPPLPPGQDSEAAAPDQPG